MTWEVDRVFVEELEQNLRPTLRRWRIPPEDAEDLLQQCFVRFLLKKDEIENPMAWMLVTLRNRCSTYWRDRRRRHDREQPREDSELEWLAGIQEAGQEQADARRDLERCLPALSFRHRELLRLRYALGYETDEIARSLAYTPASVRKLASRSLGYLKREMEKAVGG